MVHTKFSSAKAIIFTFLRQSSLLDTFHLNLKHFNRGPDADLQDGVEDRVGEARTNHFRQPIPPDDGDQLMLAQVVADEVVQDLPGVGFQKLRQSKFS